MIATKPRCNWRTRLRRNLSLVLHKTSSSRVFYIARFHRSFHRFHWTKTQVENDVCCNDFDGAHPTWLDHYLTDLAVGKIERASSVLVELFLNPLFFQFQVIERQRERGPNVA
jgi:hypothetical protein